MDEPVFRVAVVGSTGYGGGELVRLLARHPGVRIEALGARGRDDEPIGQSHPHLAGTGYRVSDELPGELDAVFVSLPHGAASETVAELAKRLVVIDLGPDFRLRDPADYPRWYGFEHPRPDLLDHSVYGLPELHREELGRLGRHGIVASPGCYATATLLALAPLAGAGLIADVVVDAKSGVSGAGREARAQFLFGEVNESVRAYGVGGHRHVAEMEQELGRLAPAPLGPIDFLPHLIPMTRGILAACHVRPTRPTSQAELDDLYRAFFASERFVELAPEPPATKHVLGSNFARVHVHADDRTGRVLVLSAIDNLVKGAAGQAVQAFNVVFGLPEESGLEQLPLSP
ncbi:MAG TPA: N-acetyl-gamma-glutamyl-phosphate reductase [Candidatus Limnocylindria bacterium]|nr:N-acetyl-gamma-glutamyl-phosphate reductase [Candidatus Limnocylindria bacterium]